MIEKFVALAGVAACVVCFAAVGAGEATGESHDARRVKAARQLEQGLYKEAGETYRSLALDRTNNVDDASRDLARALDCLENLDLYAEAEALVEAADREWSGDWRMLRQIAECRLRLSSQVRLVDGEYVRIGFWFHDGFNCAERDRVLAIRTMLAAEAALNADASVPLGAKADFYEAFINVFTANRERTKWRLTALTDLDALPDYQSYNEFYAGDNRFAPADGDGNPLYHHMPASWDAARTDGERWRWLLGRLAESGAPGTADWRFAEFLLDQFGVQTMAQGAPMPEDSEAGRETGAFAVRTLGENETIARLATGLKRFVMPDEFNHILILRRLAEDGDIRYGARARTTLAHIFENRQQYHKAVSFWQSVLDRDGDDEQAKGAIDRITGKNGMLEAGPMVPAGTRGRLSFLFRNADRVALTAYRLDENKLLNRTRELLKKQDGETLFSNQAWLHPDSIGYLAIGEKRDEFIAEKTAEWEAKLDPLPDYYSTRASIELPFSMAGIYLVEAALPGGNTSRVIVRVADLSLVNRPIGGHQLLYVADAVTGEPVAGANVTFLGYVGRRPSDFYRFQVKEFAENTDENGLVLVEQSRFDLGRERSYYGYGSWLVTARTKDGRLAYLGFDGMWNPASSQISGPGWTAFVLTDRPVYRPDQEINFKTWISRPTYEKNSPQVYTAPITMCVRNPMGEVIYNKTLAVDEYGGVADKITLDANAPLGVYSVYVDGVNGGTHFRLEEYRKPEYEVTVETPDKALTLGDAAQVKVKATYYYGSPVTDATVKYKILRTPHHGEWFPTWRWDWLYGSGCWWSSYDYFWYPGWDDWGVRAPLPPWMPRHGGQPELVAEGEGAVDADGYYRIHLDTMPAKELFGHQDHQYDITVEVMDRSRRTIVGGGKVVASRKPFAVTVWADRGYYLAGQEIAAHVNSRLPLGGGVATKGKAVLYRVNYGADGVPVETEEQSWDVATGADGMASVRMKADHPGQYRLSFQLRDAEGNRGEGASVLTIRGEPGEGDFRFADLELVPDQRDYRPGDTLKLAVNAANKNAVVLFFPRAERFGWSEAAMKAEPARPQIVRLKNGAAVLDIDVTEEDRPNFFCQAITISDGKVYAETREIFVPPVEKTLTVEVSSDKESYGPGEKAKFEVKVTDPDGNPVQGQCAITVYDKSVEYISGGSNVQDIKAYFWKWKRDFYQRFSASLTRQGYRVIKDGDVPWEPIGIFGSQEADWSSDMVHVNGAVLRGAAGGESTTRRMRMQSDMVMKAEAPMMAAPMAAVAMESDAAMAFSESAPELMQDAGGGAVVAMAEPEIRSEFADTAYWTAALETDSLGRASFEVDMPQNLTAWIARAWTMSGGARVGEGRYGVETRKNVIVRPQAPRFLTQKDQVILSANLHNYLPRAKKARAELVLEGGLLEAAEGVELVREVELAANGEARVDWLVNARRPGEARIIMKLLTDEESDAAELKVPVVVHGMRRIENFGGVVRGADTETVIALRVPEERLPGQSKLELSFSPTIAASMLEALPFLIEYPYGCTEQTLNRFLPVVMTRKFLDGMGVGLEDSRKAVDNAPDDDKSEEWKKRFGDRKSKWRGSPVFDDAELAKMVKTGVERLGNMQNSDGGWGWFSGVQERSWPHTTAVVVHGLLVADANGVAMPPAVLDGGVSWLRNYRDEQTRLLKLRVETKDSKKPEGKARAGDLDALVHMILSQRGHTSPDMRDFLYRDRLELSLSGLSMLGIALHAEGAGNFLDMVLANLEQYVEENSEIGTAWLRTPTRGWWWWYNDPVEVQAWYLKLLSRTNPSGARASGVAKHLLRNRKNGAYWQSTRDTAYAIEALSEYAVASGEAAPDMTVSVFLDGNKVMERRITAANILDDNRFVLEGVAVETGEHELRIVREGSGNLYYSGALDVFSLEDPIAAAGLELKVKRTFYRLIPEDKRVDMATSSGTATSARVENYRRERMTTPFDDDPAARVDLKPGDLVEVELTVETANDYEYLVFEDMKAAGLEAVELRSGYSNNGMGAYVEYRDQKVVLFVRYLPMGKYSISYRFRAETPGWFSALPVFAGGMYATDLFANSDEMKVKIVEEGVFE